LRAALVPVIMKLGIYTDFDVEHTLSTIPGNPGILSIRAPVLLNSQITYNHNEVSIFANSDFLAFSFDNNKPDSLSAAALIAIRNLQQMINDKYSKHLAASSFTTDPTLKIDFGPAGDFFRQAGSNPNIFEYRRFIDNFVPRTNKEKLLKQYLYNISVIAITGPDIYPVIYKQLMPAKCKFVPDKIPRDDAWGMYISTFNKSSLKFYDPIADRITLTNSLSDAEAHTRTASLRPGMLADMSWTLAGSMAKQEREQKMNAAARTIQSFWKNKVDDHKLLLYRAKQFCTSNFFKYLQEKKYALVLRNACNAANLKLVELLLQYKDRLHIDINEPSGKTHNTALDWANAAITSSVTNKENIVKLLIAAGAKSGREIMATCRRP
jgi:hypothetical protein